MTREEAPLVLDHARPQTAEIDRRFYDDEDLNTALDIGIEAIKKEPCDDTISREAVIEALNCINGTAELDKAFEVIENLPSVIPAQSVIEDITTEIETRLSRIIRDEYSQRQNDYCDGVEWAFKYCLEIIDKHISGKENE